VKCMLLKYYLAVLYYIFFELENYNLGGVSNSFWGNCLNKITPTFLNKKNLAFTFFYARVRTFFPFFCDTFFSPTYFPLPLKRCCVSWEEQKNGGAFILFYSAPLVILNLFLFRQIVARTVLETLRVVTGQVENVTAVLAVMNKLADDVG